jgi:hypothetical protein
MRSSAVLLLAVVGSLPTPAGAQDSWAVLVATARPGDMAHAIETAEHSAAALEASVGGVISGDRASARIESALTEPFRAVPPELVRRLAQAAEGILEDVAFGRNQRALDLGEPLLAEIDPHLPGLGRDPQASSDVANLCLYLVRAHHQKRDLVAARQQVLVCSRLVPDLVADEQLHPPQVRALVAEARAALEAGGGGMLAVHAAPTDPEGCSIRINGRTMGRTPWARISLTPGHYVAQIECDPDRAGRMRSVEVAGDQPTRLTIHARLAESLETRPAVALAYPSAEALSAHLVEDVSELAAAVGASRVMVAIDDGTALAVRAFAVTPAGTTLVGSAPIRPPVDDAGSLEAVRAVLRGQRLGASSVEIAEPVPSPERARGPNVASLVLGSILGVAGLTGLGVGWYYWTELEDDWRDYAALSTGDPRFVVVQESWTRDRWLTVGLGVGGGVLVTVALPFVLPEEEGVPWWSLVIAGGGAVVAGVAIWQLTEPGRLLRDDGSGTARATEPEVLGVHLLAHAVPLLSVPLVYLIRAATGDDASGAALHLEPARAELRAWGRF